MAGPYDVPMIAGTAEQEREYYIRHILQKFPERSEDPQLLYGNPKLEFLRLVNEGIIFDNYEDLTEIVSAVDLLNTKFSNFETGILKRFTTFVNVKDFGATGNGFTDETANIQKAMDKLKLEGGGVLYFPPGDYYLYGHVLLTSNIVITGSKATLIKKPTSWAYTCFAASSGNNKGYGAGASNIIMYNMAFKGEFTNNGVGGRSLCAMALHHSQDVIAHNNDFIECSWGGHRFDLQGCRRITIRDNVFHGHDDLSSSALFYNEDIQLDNSTRGGGSFNEPAGATCYDGLPCEDITVENNKWVTYVKNGRVYPASNPIGTHAAVENYYHKRIRIRDNFIGPGISDPVNNVNGRIHFLVWDDVIIEGNTFDGNGVDMAGIRGYHCSRSFEVKDLDKLDNTSVVLPVHHMNKNIVIRDNVFRNFKSPIAAQPCVIQFSDHVSNLGLSYHKNIHIVNNTFEDNKYGDIVTNNSHNLIGLSSCEEFKIEGNFGERQRRGIWVLRSRNGDVKSNKFKDSSNNVIGVDSSSNVTVSENTITGLTGSPCITIVGGNDIITKDNIIRSESPNATGIRYTAVTGGSATINGIITGNRIEGIGVPLEVAVNVAGGSKVHLMKDNMLKNVTLPLQVTGASSVTKEIGTEVLA